MDDEFAVPSLGLPHFGAVEGEAAVPILGEVLPVPFAGPQGIAVIFDKRS